MAGPTPSSTIHLSVIPTYTEPYHVLERTVQAIVDANYPPELKMIGIITRETDKPGWANVARLKEKFGDRLRGFYHIKDPLEPGIVIGKSAAMNWGGRWMVRVLTEEGLRPRQGPDHRSRLRLPGASAVLRVDQLAPRS